MCLIIQQLPNIKENRITFLILQHVVVDTTCCNKIGLTDDVGAGIAGGYSAHRIEQMAKAISKNETMSGPISSLKEFKENRKRIRGPKGTGRSIGLAEKPPHPKFKDLFDLRIRIKFLLF